MKLAHNRQLVAIDIHDLESFKAIIWGYFNSSGRDFSWRKTTSPYYVVVSEIMLQQTQTHRVTQKFEAFVIRFPDFSTLAQASLEDILACWLGLGYNRRALFLKKIAQMVVQDHQGTLPLDPDVLSQFPGIGKATAASICAFAFNQPTIFIETNIRTVFIHFFFKNQEKVHDNDIYPLVAETVDKEKPRLWYYALMDYGVMLKKLYPNPSRKSFHHQKQSKFEGSDRQIRGRILKILTEYKKIDYQEIIEKISAEKERINRLLSDLINEGFVKQSENFLSLF